MDNKQTLTFLALRAANIERCKKWHPGGVLDWSVSDWYSATQGEAGEILEVVLQRLKVLTKAGDTVKKLNRVRDGLVGNSKTPDELRTQLAHEIADTAIYLDLLAEAAGVDLGGAIIEKFNIVSERNGFPDRLNPTPSPKIGREDLAKAYAHLRWGPQAHPGAESYHFADALISRWPDVFGKE